MMDTHDHQVYNLLIVYGSNNHNVRDFFEKNRMTKNELNNIRGICQTFLRYKTILPSEYNSDPYHDPTNIDYMKYDVPKDISDLSFQKLLAIIYLYSLCK